MENYIKFTLIALAFSSAASAVDAKAIEITRQIPVDETFSDISSGNKSGFAGGIETRMKVIAPDGVIELCGAIAYTNPQLRSIYKKILRNTHFKVNDTRVFKGLHYFKDAKRANKLDSAQANCRSTGVKVQRGDMKFDFDFPKGRYRVN